MTRREFTQHIAITWAIFELEWEGKPSPFDDDDRPVRIQPLNREYAFAVGNRLVEAGTYKPRKACLDYELVAREARNQLGFARRVARA